MKQILSVNESIVALRNEKGSYNCKTADGVEK